LDENSSKSESLALTASDAVSANFCVLRQKALLAGTKALHCLDADTSSKVMHIGEIRNILFGFGQNVC
jgi:hypothetical protein